MVRNFFAFIVSLPFLFIFPPLLIMQSITATMLDQEYVSEKILPESYEPVMTRIAQQFAADGAAASLMGERISTIVPKDVYVRMLAKLSDDFFSKKSSLQNSGEPKINLRLLKSLIQEELPAMVDRAPHCEADEQEGFRFCKPAQLSAALSEGGGNAFESRLRDVVEKSIPAEVPLKNVEAQNINDAVKSMFLVKEYLPLALAIFAAALFGILYLVLWSSSKTLIRGGGVCLTIGVLLIIFLVSIKRLPEIVPIFEGLSRADIDLIKFFAGIPSSYIRSLAIGGTAFGAASIVAGIVLKSRR